MNIQELAAQAGLKRKTDEFFSEFCDGVYDGDLERFADLVAAHTLMNIDPSKFIGGYQVGFDAGVAKEREECAKVCEPQSNWDDPLTAYEIAKAIRARSKA